MSKQEVSNSKVGGSDGVVGSMNELIQELDRAFTNNRFREFSEVEFIDIRSHEDIEAAWEDFLF